MNGPLCAVPVVTTLSSDDRASVCGPCGRCWVALRPQWAVLGRSWGLSGRSWAAPWAAVVGPRLLLAAKWPFLERERDLGEGQIPEEPEAAEASYPFFLLFIYLFIYLYIYIIYTCIYIYIYIYIYI